MIQNKLWCFSLRNFGDALTPFILGRLGINFEIVQDSAEADLFGIGSILRRVGAPQHLTRVWTSGMISPQVGTKLTFNSKVEILALRGELTREKIVSPDVSQTPTGDGALLLRHLYDWRKIAKQHDIGIVAHMQDRRSPLVRRLVEENRCLLIDVLKPVEEVLRAIAACRFIVSSSLHGIIVADAFSVPGIAVRFSDTKKEIDDAGKFLDYGSAVGRVPAPSPVGSFEDLMNHVSSAEHKVCESQVESAILRILPTLDLLR